MYIYQSRKIKHLKISLSIYLALLFANVLHGQNIDTTQYWKITERESIVWDLTKENTLPHSDNIEMAGKKVASIIYYEVDGANNLTITKDIIFPQLRTYNKSNEPDWKKYRAYYRKKIDDHLAPAINLGNKIIVPSKVDSVEINGMITFYYTPVEDLQITRSTFPSMDERLLIEEWEIKNVGTTQKDIFISPVSYTHAEKGYKGQYMFSVSTDAKEEVALLSNESYSYHVSFSSRINDEMINLNGDDAKNSRLAFLQTCKNNLTLITPNNVINTLFYFSKIRAAESIYDSSMGLVHSPGGGNYYVGIWANDQVEYSGPFFPYLGYKDGNTAAYNTYKKFLENIPEKGHVPYAFEVDGNFPMTHLDRGDAAMIAYGTSQYILASGNKEQAKELWPLVEWSLDYCEHKKNDQGAIQSDSDEMEGRIETGSANLSTSSLYYGGLNLSINIANELGLSQKAKEYKQRLQNMDDVIETYFGANIEGLDTYRYFDGNTLLRHWICLPLVMGITDRKEATIQALFDKLWTDNGVLVEYDPNTDEKEDAMFWDRATLYCLRGTMIVGEIEKTYGKLLQYSQKRLLGDHVPYAVEAYPENQMKHLSAESALYCRIFIEGLLGVKPLSMTEVAFHPRLPEDWDFIRFENIYVSGMPLDIDIKRVSSGIHVNINAVTKRLYEGVSTQGAELKLILR